MVAMITYNIIVRFHNGKEPLFLRLVSRNLLSWSEVDKLLKREYPEQFKAWEFLANPTTLYHESCDAVKTNHLDHLVLPS